MTLRFYKQFKDGGSVFDATTYDIETSVLFAAKGDKNIAEDIRKKIARSFYTEALPLETNFSKLWSVGE